MPSESLPDEVLERLTDEQRAALIDKRTTRKGNVEVETRTLVQAQPLSLDESEGWNLRGYATVYNYAYPIAGGPENGGWMEIIERGATSKSIKDGASVPLLLNHDGLPLARSGGVNPTMELISDDFGLRVDADLDPASPYAQSVRSAITRGDVEAMSFAFVVQRQEWVDSPAGPKTERRIKELRLHDVSAVNEPANPSTVVQMNSTTTDTEARNLDPEAEAAEDTIVDQIRQLLAQLIAGEAAELEAGSPAAQSIRALVGVLCALDWWEEVDEAEDASGDSEEIDEMEPAMARSISLADALAEIATVRNTAA